MNRAGVADIPSGTYQTSYFYLSYAHSPPTPRRDGDRADVWVRRFFTELSDQVRTLSRREDRIRPGYFDQEVSLGANWPAELARMLGTAEVFVPLYSPGYFRRSWPLRERASFQGRLADARTARAQDHLIPVLWTPLPPWSNQADVIEAGRIGADIPEYGENGLRALRMLAPYRRHYDTIVARLAHRIVELAELFPVGPSVARGLDQDPQGPQPDPEFLVVVAAPTRDQGREIPFADRLGADAAGWRPFGGDQELPAAQYVASTAERLGLSTRIVSHAAVGTMLDRFPAVVLIDPWLLTTASGERMVDTLARRLPRWAVPVVVVHPGDRVTAPGVSALVTTVLGKLASPGKPEPTTVREMRTFVETLPELISDARRRYLKDTPAYSVPPDSPPRYSLRDRPPVPGSPDGGDQ